MPAATATLSVLWPDESPGPSPPAHDGLSAELRLTEFFWRYAWPEVFEPRGDCRRTLADYLTTLRHWQRLVCDPPIRQIEKRHLALFVRLLGGLKDKHGAPRMGRNTIWKHWQIISRLLRFCGPEGRHNREGAGLIDAPPWTPPPKRERKAPRRGLKLDEIDLWLRALPAHARAMPKIGNADPVAWWRAVILLTYNTGLRPMTAFAVRWEQLDGHRLVVPPASAKGGRGKLHWLNDAALEAVRPLRRGGGLILNWHGWPAGETTFRKHRRLIQLGAGIPPLSLYALRRTFATELARINPLAAQIAMGHEGLGMAMMINHYLDPEKLLGEALAKLPQPGRLVQRELF